jgi:hypothetical protein
MLTHPTLDQLRALRLDGMAAAFAELQAQDGVDDLPGRLARPADRPRARRSQHPALPHQAPRRGAAPCRRRYRGCRLPHSPPARPGAVPAARHRHMDRGAPQSLDHRALRRRQDLARLRSRSEGLPRQPHRPLQASARPFAELELAHGDGRFPRLFRSLVKVDLLILDDWGPDRMTAGQRRDLMEIVEDRSGAGSTLVSSQLPLDAWHAVIGEPHLRRRHPRPPGPHRLPPRPRRPVDAQAEGWRRDTRPGHERHAPPDARPRASTGPSRARRRASPELGTPRRAGPSH